MSLIVSDAFTKTQHLTDVWDWNIDLTIDSTLTKLWKPWPCLFYLIDDHLHSFKSHLSHEFSRGVYPMQWQPSAMTFTIKNGWDIPRPRNDRPDVVPASAEVKRGSISPIHIRISIYISFLIPMNKRWFQRPDSSSWSSVFQSVLFLMPRVIHSHGFP